MLFNRSTALKPIVAMAALLLLTAAKGEGCTISVEGIEEQAEEALDEFDEGVGEDEICPPAMHLELICEGDLGPEAGFATEPGEEGEPAHPPVGEGEPGDEYGTDEPGPLAEPGEEMCYEECVPDAYPEGEDDWVETGDEDTLEDDCDGHAEPPEDEEDQTEV